jgi:hypothetical protein
MEPLEGNMPGAQEPELLLTLRQRIAERAKRSPELGFTSLAHLLDFGWMREAYRSTRKDGAAGVDGQTAQDYEANLEDNLRGLLDRAKSGTYRAPPVRRVHIPKGTGNETRPIGIPTLEDKVLQRAVVMALETVYEQDFLVQKLRGHFAYYGLTGNAHALRQFRDGVVRTWRHWLSRRRRCGQRNWDFFHRLLARYPLPAPVVVHSIYRHAGKAVS